MNAIARSRALVQEGFANDNRWEANMAAAEALLTKAMSEAPEDIDILTGLGAVLCDQAKYRHAADVLERAVRLGSTDSNTHYNLGVAWVGCATGKKAAAAFDRARGFSASPDTWTAYFDPQAQ